VDGCESTLVLNAGDVVNVDGYALYRGKLWHDAPRVVFMFTFEAQS
jgi:hypothetical protein